MKDLLSFLREIGSVSTGTLVGFALGLYLSIFYSASLPLPLILLSSIIGSLCGRVVHYIRENYFGVGSKLDSIIKLKSLDKIKDEISPVEYMNYRRALKKMIALGSDYDKMFKKEKEHQDYVAEEYDRDKDLYDYNFERIVRHHRIRFKYEMEGVYKKTINQFEIELRRDVEASVKRELKIDLNKRINAQFANMMSRNEFLDKENMEVFLRAEIQSELTKYAMDLEVHIIDQVISHVLNKVEKKDAPIKGDNPPIVDSKLSEELDTNTTQNLENAKRRKTRRSKKKNLKNERLQLKSKKEIQKDEDILDINQQPKEPEKEIISQTTKKNSDNTDST